MSLRTAADDGIVGRLSAHGDRPALRHGASVVSYAELARRTSARADALGSGRRLVVIEGANVVDTVVTLLACRAAGHAAWLVPAGRDWAASAAIARFDPDTVVAAGQVVVRAEVAQHTLHPHLALLLGTSGSTGSARLVRLSGRNLDANASSIARYLRLTSADVGITTLPLSYSYGLSVLTSHLSVGASVVVTDRSMTDPAFWRDVAAHGVTGIAGVAYTYELLDRLGGTDRLPEHVRYLTQSGGRMEPEVVARFARAMRRRGGELFVMYGQTEATARIAYLPPELTERHPSTVGIPIPGGEVSIDADDPSGPGELVYRGPNVMMGYADHPDDLALGAATDVLRTGDLARRTPEGLIEIVGRRSRIVKPFGIRVDLDDAERVLADIGVSALCAGDDACISVAITDGARVEEARLELARRLGLPARLVRVGAWDVAPRLESGKPDYVAVRQLTATADATGPRDDAATCPVARIFRDALGIHAVRPTDTFVDLGGDSLSYVEVSLGLERVVGTPPPDWPTMTVAELRDRCGGAASPRKRAPRTRRVETALVLRAAAIGLVVAGHMRDFMPKGGAHVLLLLVGFSFARFQLGVTDLSVRLRRGLAMVAHIALPTMAWVGARMLLVGGYGSSTFLLVNNYFGSDWIIEDRRWVFWFIEVVVQFMAVVVPLMCIPVVARLQRRLPFALPMSLAVAGLGVGYLAAATGEPNYILVTHATAWLIFLGWAIREASDTLRRVAVTVLGVPGALTFFDDADRALLVAAGLLALIWLPTVRVPSLAVRPIGAVAAASLALYITHWPIWPVLDERLPFLAAWALTLASGVVIWRVWSGLLTAGRTAVSRRRRPEPRRQRGAVPVDVPNG